MIMTAASYWVLIVSFAQGPTGGLYLAQLDTKAQTLTQVQHITEGINRPIFARFSADGSQLFVADDVGDDPDSRNGALAIFDFDKKTGKLTLKGRTSTQGRSSCYVGLTDKLALVANYSQGNIIAIPYDKTGPLPGAMTFEHQGSSVNTRRQKGPHPHSFVPSPSGRFALSADLGTDEVYIYPVHGAKVEHASSVIKMKPGAGPRHIAFSPDGKMMFIVNELDGTLCSFAWDDTKGQADLLDCNPTLPTDFTGQNTAADIYTHPFRPLVYTSNRGLDSIAVSACDKAGKLMLKANIPSGGGHPRGFTITPDGRFILVANRDSDNVVLFAVDPETGLPAATGKTLTIPKPMCITTQPRPRK